MKWIKISAFIGIFLILINLISIGFGFFILSLPLLDFSSGDGDVSLPNDSDDSQGLLSLIFVGLISVFFLICIGFFYWGFFVLGDFTSRGFLKAMSVILFIFYFLFFIFVLFYPYFFSDSDLGSFETISEGDSDSSLFNPAVLNWIIFASLILFLICQILFLVSYISLKNIVDFSFTSSLVGIIFISLILILIVTFILILSFNPTLIVKFFLSYFFERVTQIIVLVSYSVLSLIGLVYLVFLVISLFYASSRFENVSYDGNFSYVEDNSKKVEKKVDLVSETADLKNEDFGKSVNLRPKPIHKKIEPKKLPSADNDNSNVVESDAVDKYSYP